jgi:hypothetical protein
MQKEDEVEVVHLEWERVEDPTRDPPPEMVVVEPAPEKPRILPDLNGPNPLKSFPQMTTLQEIVTFMLVIIGVALWVVLRGAP